jgi:hypothetical protein
MRVTKWFTMIDQAMPAGAPRWARRFIAIGVVLVAQTSL